MLDTLSGTTDKSSNPCRGQTPTSCQSLRGEASDHGRQVPYLLTEETLFAKRVLMLPLACLLACLLFRRSGFHIAPSKSNDGSNNNNNNNNERPKFQTGKRFTRQGRRSRQRSERSVELTAKSEHPPPHLPIRCAVLPASQSIVRSVRRPSERSGERAGGRSVGCLSVCVSVRPSFRLLGKQPAFQSQRPSISMKQSTACLDRHPNFQIESSWVDIDSMIFMIHISSPRVNISDRLFSRSSTFLPFTVQAFASSSHDSVTISLVRPSADYRQVFVTPSRRSIRCFLFRTCSCHESS